MMRVSQSQAAQYQYSATVRKLAGVGLPDFTQIGNNTRTESKTTKEEFRQAIIEQAQKDFAAGHFQSSAGFKALEKKYVSEVSPDRKGILTQGLKKIEKQMTVKEPLSLADIFFNIKEERGQRTLTYAEFYDANGEMVASYSKGEWKMYDTDAEAARKIGMAMIYNAAWGEAKRTSERAEQAVAAGAGEMTAGILDVTA